MSELAEAPACKLTCPGYTRGALEPGGSVLYVANKDWPNSGSKGKGQICVVSVVLIGKISL